MVLGKTVADITEYLGHDGSEIWFPEAAGNNQRRGFHMQEMFDYSLDLGYWPVYIESMPETAERLLPMPDGRFEQYLWQNNAVLLGRGADNSDDQFHAAAWDQNNVFDPRGQEYDITEFQLHAIVIFGAL